MPADNIDRAVKKGTGELGGITIEEMLYEGYGPGGVGLIVEVTTDNKNRSASEIQALFPREETLPAGRLPLTSNAKARFFLPRTRWTKTP